MHAIIFDFYGVIFNPVTGKPTDGLKDFLEKLHSHNIKCGVASSSNSASIATFLDEHDLINFFPVIIGADKVSNTKPNPECYQTVAEFYDARPNDCVVIDDSMAAVAQAKAAGFNTVYFGPDQARGLDNFEKIAILLGL